MLFITRLTLDDISFNICTLLIENIEKYRINVIKTRVLFTREDLNANLDT